MKSNSSDQALVAKLNEYINHPVEQWPVKLFAVGCDENGRVEFGELKDGTRFVRQQNSQGCSEFVLR